MEKMKCQSISYSNQLQTIPLTAQSYNIIRSNKIDKNIGWPRKVEIEKALVIENKIKEIL
jgi:hypothetical protein